MTDLLDAANGAWESLRHKASQIKIIPISGIRIDHRFQRALNPNAVNKIKSEYHPKGTGQVLVAEVEPETPGESALACLDGQTRLVSLTEIQQEIAEGLRQADGFVPEVTAEVFEKLTVEEAALLFRLRNQQRPVPPRERDRIMVFEGDPLMNEVVKQAADAGFKVFDLDDQNDVDLPSRALPDAKMIVRLEKEQHAGLLTRALTIQANAFETPDGTKLGTIEPKVLAATARLLRNNPNINEDELTRVMTAIGLPSLMATAQQQTATTGGRLEGAVRTTLVERYNKNKRGADRIRR